MTRLHVGLLVWFLLIPAIGLFLMLVGVDVSVFDNFFYSPLGVFSGFVFGFLIDMLTRKNPKN